MKYEGKTLTIGASDTTDGSSMDTDMNTFCSFDVLGKHIQTAVISSTKSDKKNIHIIPPEIIDGQLNSLMDEFDFGAIKIGLIPNEKAIDNISANIDENDIDILVLDPVFLDKNAHDFISKDIEKFLIKKLLPNSYIVILDIEEAEIIADMKINDQKTAKKAAEILHNNGPDLVFIKSSDLDDGSSDILFDGENFEEFDGYKTSIKDKKEADSTFSAAITACLSKGISVKRSLDISIDYVRRAILSSTKRTEIGKTHLDHNVKPLDVSAFEEEAADFDSWFENNKNVFESEFKAEEKLMLNAENAVSIGVGSGLFASRLGIKHGVEPARGMAELAREKGIDVTRGYAENVPIKDHEFETVLMSTVLSYVDDPQKAVDEAYRILKNGGHVVISFLPKEGSYTMMYDLAIMRGKHDPEISPDYPYPIKFIKGSNWLSTERVTELMKNAGFKDLKYVQTLTKHPKYTNKEVEEPIDGYEKGDYVVIRGEKP